MTTDRSTADLLSDLNALRIAAGKTALSSWKASRADLIERIAQMQPAPVATAPVAADPKAIAEVINADVPVTVIPATAPELTKPAKRNAAIAKIVNTSVEQDKPTTVIEVNKAARSLRKEASDATKLAKLGKVTTPKAKATKSTKAAPKTTTPSTNEFGAYLQSISMDAKIARAKLRRAGFSAPYAVTAELKAALTTDARKKAK